MTRGRTSNSQTPPTTYGACSYPTTGGFTIVELLIVVVVIAILAAITIVSYNGITKQANEASRDSTIAQWKKQASLYKIEHEIQCPANYVFVYGNEDLGTDDFCVMKYEAKIQGNDVGTTTYNSSMVAESRASGTPWVNITQTNAITEATEAGGHMLTEAEWMTIAADVLSVKYNWSGGTVGSGYIYNGHVNSNPASGLSASTDDTDSLYGITGGTGTTVGTNSQRTLLLSTGDTIWDLSGNVWEWTQQTIGTPTFTTSNIGVAGDSAFAWRDYTNGSLSLANLPTVSRPSALAGNETLGAIGSWDNSKGIGRVYANYADASARAFQRGGPWSNTSNVGVLALNLSYTGSGWGTSIGFRVAQ